MAIPLVARGQATAPAEGPAGDKPALATRPAAGSRFEAPPRVFDFLHMDLDLTFTSADLANRRMEGVVEYRIRLADRRDGDAPPARLRLEAIGLDVHRVEVGPNWRPAPFSQDREALNIDLEGLARPGRELLLRIAYSVSAPKRGLYFVTPDADHPEREPCAYTISEPLQARCWVPCRDWPDTRWTSDIHISVPQGLMAVSVGAPVGEPTALTADEREARRSAMGFPPPPGATVERPSPFHKPMLHDAAPEDLVTHHWRIEQPIDPHMLGFAIGDYAPQRTEWRGRPVFVYASTANAHAAAYTFRRVPEMLEFYSKLLGVEFPFPQYGHAIAERHVHGGMEHAGFSVLAADLLSSGPRGDVPEERAQFNFVAHMLGHQWFAGLVNYGDLREAWLNEAFATYLHLLWRGQADSADALDDEFWTLAERIARHDQAARGLVPAALTSWDEVYDFDAGKVYWKGAWVLHMLRHELGDDVFWRGVRQYLNDHRPAASAAAPDLFAGGVATTDDLRRALEASGGRDLRGFFEQWVQRGGTPRLKIEYRWDKDERRARVDVRQTQTIDDDHPPFRLPLELYFQTASASRSEPVVIDRAEQSFDFAFTEPPLAFCADPFGRLLAVRNETKPRTMWLAQIEVGPSPLARSQAMAHFSDSVDAKLLPYLGNALADPGEFWGVKRRAVELLARLDAPEVLDILLAAERSEQEPRLLASIVSALGRRTKSEAAYSAVLGRADSEEDIVVQAAAIEALVRFERRLRGEEAARAIVAAAAPATSRYVREPALRVAQEEPRALPGLTTILASGPQAEVEYMSPLIRRIGRMARGAGEPERAAAASAISSALNDPRPRVRTTAAEALAELGGPQALAGLRSRLGEEADEDVRKALQTAIEKLATPMPTSAPAAAASQPEGE